MAISTGNDPLSGAPDAGVRGRSAYGAAPAVQPSPAMAIPLPDPISEKKRTRMRYDPLSAHDYNGTDQPSLREVAPGHFVHCNDAEYMAYRREMGL